MLGARARAAEYNAARAASARQANREAEEHSLPPKLTPISLSAFTRGLPISRNRGIKAFKPLILSDTTEDTRSTDSLESILQAERDSTSIMMDMTNNRPASLPRSNNLSVTSDLQDIIEYPQGVIPHAPRAMLSDKDLAILGHNTSLQFNPTSLLPLSHYSTSPFLSLPMTPASYASWHNANLIAYNNSSMLSMTNHTPNHPRSEPPRIPIGPLKRSLSQPERSSNMSHTEKLRNIRAWRTDPEKARFVFGPDDLSPSKAQMKEQRRRDWMNHNSAQILPYHIATPKTMTSNDSHHTSPLVIRSRDKTAEISQESQVRIEHATHSFRQVHETPHHLHAYPHIKPGLEFPETKVQMEGSSVKTQMPSSIVAPLNKDTFDEQLFELISRGPLQKLDQERLAPFKPEERALLEEIATLQKRRNQNQSEPIQPEHVAVSKSSQDGSTSGNSAGHKSMQDCSRPENLIIDKPVQEQSPHRDPFFNIYAPGWCELRPITESERNKMRSLVRSIRTSMSINMEDIQAAGRPCPDWNEEKQNSEAASVRNTGRERVESLATEFLQKHTTEDIRLNNDSCDREIGAAMIKAVGNVYATLNEYQEESKTSSPGHLRRFVSPPDYAIERSVQFDGSKGKSIFGADDGEAIAAPARIARDPRFRPQVTDTLISQQSTERRSRTSRGIGRPSRRI